MRLTKPLRTKWGLSIAGGLYRDDPAKPAIARRFGRAFLSYDQAAGLQLQVAQLLAAEILAQPLEAPATVLEIGGGTGALTRQLLPVLNAGRYLFTDLAEPMVGQAAAQLGRAAVLPVVMDGECPAVAPASVDMVVTSLAVQWFRQPWQSLPALMALLKPGGVLWFSTLLAGSLAEWQQAVTGAGLESGVIPLLTLDQLHGLFPAPARLQGRVVGIPRVHDSALAFLQNLRAIGAAQSPMSHQPAPVAALRGLLASQPKPYTVTYQVWLGSARLAKILD
jgi:malonyl-CoA O-methyltransferase